MHKSKLQQFVSTVFRTVEAAKGRVANTWTWPGSPTVPVGRTKGHRAGGQVELVLWMRRTLIDLARFTYSPWLTSRGIRRSRGHACGETHFGEEAPHSPDCSNHWALLFSDDAKKKGGGMMADGRCQEVSSRVWNPSTGEQQVTTTPSHHSSRHFLSSFLCRKNPRLSGSSCC